MLGLRGFNDPSGTLVMVLIVVVAQAIELDLTATATCMDELAVTGIDSDMANATMISRAKEHQVSWLQVVGLDRLTYMRLLSAGSRKVNALCLIDLPRKATAVRPRPGTGSVAVRHATHRYRSLQQRICFGIVVQEYCGLT